MQIAAIRNLFNFTDLPSLNRLAGMQPAVGLREFYQQFAPRFVKGVLGKKLFCELAETAVSLAHHAYTFRRFDVIEQASQVLLNLPLPQEYRSIGLYYRAVCIQKKGYSHKAFMLLEQVAEEAPLRYRARATHLLGLFTHAQGDLQGAFSLYLEASRIAASNNWCDPQTTINSRQSIAILKSIDGNHRQALADLESLFPLVRTIGTSDPYKYYHFLNSFAVELGELRRFDEAKNICKIVLASPYAFAYPEWRETGNEIALRGYQSRSVRRIHRKLLNRKNVLPMPAPAQAQVRVPAGATFGNAEGSARLFDLLEWKEKMGKEPNGNEKDSKPAEEMTEREMIYRIINLFTQPGISEEKRLAMLRSVEKIASMPDETPEEDSERD